MEGKDRRGGSRAKKERAEILTERLKEVSEVKKGVR